VAGTAVVATSVGEEVPGMTVGVGNAAVAVAGAGVEGGGVSCPLLHAARESITHKKRSRRMDQLLISRVSASMISPESPDECPSNESRCS
jgi:hypothetical protein